MIGTWLKAVFVQRVADFGHPAVHHVRRGHHVGSGLGVGQGRAGQQVQGGVVIDDLFFHHAAVAVIGVLAQADVGDHDQLRQFAS